MSWYKGGPFKILFPAKFFWKTLINVTKSKKHLLREFIHDHMCCIYSVCIWETLCPLTRLAASFEVATMFPCSSSTLMPSDSSLWRISNTLHTLAVAMRKRKDRKGGQNRSCNEMKRSLVDLEMLLIEMTCICFYL